MNAKCSTIATLIILAFIATGTIYYFAILQRSSTPTPTPTPTNFEGNAESKNLIVSARDAETGMAIYDINERYIVNNQTYTADELNDYLTQAKPGRYDITVQTDGYKQMSFYVVLPVSSPLTLLLDPLSQPPEFSDNYLQQFAKQGMGLLIGYVVDKDGQPLSGVRVMSPSQSETTNYRGFYALSVIVPESASCAGIDLTYSKSGYKSEKHLHAMSGSIAPGPSDSVSGLWDYMMNIVLLKGSGENITDDTHKNCP